MVDRQGSIPKRTSELASVFLTIYTTVDPKQFVFSTSEHCWEAKHCKAKADTAAQSLETHVGTGRQM